MPRAIRIPFFMSYILSYARYNNTTPQNYVLRRPFIIPYLLGFTYIPYISILLTSHYQKRGLSASLIHDYVLFFFIQFHVFIDFNNSIKIFIVFI